MKASFDWKQLHKNKCPNMICSDAIRLSYLKETDQWKCKQCGYLIVDWKLQDIKKGKSSKYYQDSIYKRLKYHKQPSIRKDRLQLYLQLQEKERQSNRIKIQQMKQN